MDDYSNSYSGEKRYNQGGGNNQYEEYNAGQIPYGQPNSEVMDSILKIRDLEEKQNILKERLLLIGQNLIELKEKTSKDILEIKKSLEVFHQTIERVESFLETASNEFSKFAKKEDVEILAKQAKMFQPLELLKKSEE